MASRAPVPDPKRSLRACLKVLTKYIEAARRDPGGKAADELRKHRNELLALKSAVRQARVSHDRDLPSVIVLQGNGIGPILSPEEGRSRLAAMTSDERFLDWIESEVLGSEELVAKLGISRSELARWRKTKRVVAFSSRPRQYIYPLRQFKGKAPVEGLERIASFFPSPEVTWVFLISPNRVLDMSTPIDALQRGEASQVASIAEAVAWGAFF